MAHSGGRHPNPLARKYGHHLPGSKAVQQRRTERESGASTSKAVLRKQIRDIRRLLASRSHGAQQQQQQQQQQQEQELFNANVPNYNSVHDGEHGSGSSGVGQQSQQRPLPATKVLELERKLAFLTAQLDTREQDIVERKMWEKYKYVRFVEQKKLKRRIDQVENRIDQLVQDIEAEAGPQSDDDDDMDEEDALTAVQDAIRPSETKKSHGKSGEDKRDAGEDDDGDEFSDARDESDDALDEDEEEEDTEMESDSEVSQDTTPNTMRQLKRNEQIKRKLLLNNLYNQLNGLKIKFAYAKHYPKDMKYMSLFPKNQAQQSSASLATETGSSVGSTDENLSNSNNSNNNSNGRSQVPNGSTSVNNNKATGGADATDRLGEGDGQEGNISRTEVKNLVNVGLSDAGKELQEKIFNRLKTAFVTGEIEHPAFELRQRDL